MSERVELPEVAVIMPTLGTRKRASSLKRALESVLSQDGVRTIPIVVFNGPTADGALVDEVGCYSRGRVLVLQHGNLPDALRAGRLLVEEPWFGTLDDDDELLPGALALRVDVLTRNPTAGVAITNGLRRGKLGDRLHLEDMEDVRSDPLAALMSRNWLLSGSWLCRSDAVSPSLLDGMPPYLECTYLAIRLATATRLEFVEDPTVIYNEDTPDSASKSLNSVVGLEPALRRLLELDLPPDVRQSLRLRLAPACWDAAGALARAGNLGAACRWYGRAFLRPGGWRFVPHAATKLARLPMSR